jgi:hypothetical protein
MELEVHQDDVKRANSLVTETISIHEIAANVNLIVQLEERA